ncbi:hypothetical protein ACVIW2_007147 [Bradyrhizobium huanghuaihaiense]|uniref:Uncharacterized protein n=1 Tax=Bradyrhizobium huanghuaihaiense TaxID=990078 RepID=A0A562RUA5_9BRAD|nr:hypothetical protein IQ16_02131 [Bradyrhizobium huanghuaihaiense]
MEKPRRTGFPAFAGNDSGGRGAHLCERGYFDGAGLKSTFGAVEISFSFSTEKFGFSL